MATITITANCTAALIRELAPLHVEARTIVRARDNLARVIERASRMKRERSTPPATNVN